MEAVAVALVVLAVTLAMILSGCGSSAAPKVAPEDLGKSCGNYWQCRGCERLATSDFACTGHEFLTSAYDCPFEFDLCKRNAYGSLCCWPVE